MRKDTKSGWASTNEKCADLYHLRLYIMIDNITLTT